MFDSSSPIHFELVCVGVGCACAPRTSPIELVPHDSPSWTRVLVVHRVSTPRFSFPDLPCTHVCWLCVCSEGLVLSSWYYRDWICDGLVAFGSGRPQDHAPTQT